MRVICVPARLRLAMGLLILSLPLAVLETVLSTRLPWWRLNIRNIQVWAVAAAIASIFLAIAVGRGSKNALRVLGVLAIGWCLVSCLSAIRLKNPSLGFFALLLVAFWGSAWFWLRHEVSRSFFDPHMSWYQGLPEAIPALKCLIATGDQREEHKVARLDQDGAFIFSDRPSGSRHFAGLKKGLATELTFCLRDRQIKCQGVPVRILERNQGAGFQFRNISPDAYKEIGDFVENLRGEGYVE